MLWQDHGVHVGVEEEADSRRTVTCGQQPLAGLDHWLETLDGPGRGVAPVHGQGDVNAHGGHVRQLALVPLHAAPVQGGIVGRTLRQGRIVQTGPVVPVVEVGHDQPVVRTEAGSVSRALVCRAGGWVRATGGPARRGSALTGPERGGIAWLGGGQGRPGCVWTVRLIGGVVVECVVGLAGGDDAAGRLVGGCVILGACDPGRAAGGGVKGEQDGKRQQPPCQDQLPGCRVALPPSFRLLHQVPFVPPRSPRDALSVRERLAGTRCHTRW